MWGYFAGSLAVPKWAASTEQCLSGAMSVSLHSDVSVIKLVNAGQGKKGGPMGLKLIGSIAALVLIAACETVPEEMADADGGGAAAALGAAGPQVAAGPVTPGQAASVVAPEDAPPAPGSFDEFVKLVGDRVYFGFDQIDLLPRSQETLERQAEWLLLYPAINIVIQGHADERGTREYNLALGERRANAVRNFLVALNVDASRISTVSYGKERPVALGSNVTAWALNRRAVSQIEGGPAVN